MPKTDKHIVEQRITLIFTYLVRDMRKSQIVEALEGLRKNKDNKLDLNFGDRQLDTYISKAKQEILLHQKYKRSYLFYQSKCRYDEAYRGAINKGRYKEAVMANTARDKLLGLQGGE